MLEARERSHHVHLDNLGDLRRRARADIADRILARAEHLPDCDRALLQAFYRDGSSAKELARLARTSSRILRLRVRRLVQRVSSPTFALVLRDAHTWPDDRRRVAFLHVIQGRSIRAVARSLNLSLHHVRAHLAWIGMHIESLDPSTTTRVNTAETRS